MFFEAIRDKVKAVKKIPDRLDIITKRALRPLAGQIAELNQEQLKKGMRSDGSFLPDYSKRSVEEFGKPEGPIKLFDTGDFYKGINPVFDASGFTLQGKDSKTEYLQNGGGGNFSNEFGFTGTEFRGYGEDILGLTDRSVFEIGTEAIGQIQYELKKEL